MVVTMVDVQLNIDTCKNNVNISGISHNNNISENCDVTVIESNMSSMSFSKDNVHCNAKDSSSSVISTSDVTTWRMEDDYSQCPDIPLPEGPLDPRSLMDLKFIKTILDNLVTPRETHIVLELVVDFIKQETGQCLQGQLDNLKDFGARLLSIDKRHEQLKASLSKYKDYLTSVQQKVTENQTKLKRASDAH